MLTSLWRRMSKRRAPIAKWELSTPLLRWTRDDAWMLRDAVEGTLILGATGSGKTSGSGAAIARSYLAAGFGGLVLTAKADERALWERYCQEAGRLDDLLVFAPSERADLRFNFLDFELNRTGDGAGHTESIVNLFANVLEVVERNSGTEGGRGDESFWRRTNRQLMRNLVDLLALATGRVSVPDLVRLCLSAPTSSAQINDKGWQERSFCFHCLKEADRREKSERQKHDFGIVADFFLLEWPNLSDKTRSVVMATFTSMADVLNRGVLRELFCKDTNVTPKAVEEGKIILIDLPVKEYAEVGQFAQVLWKYSFMRSIERRDAAANPRPVFLWADEAQLFTTSYDFQFQSTCRSARCATVYLSQSTTNFYAALGGGDKGQNEAHSLFQCLNTKVFHACTDKTPEWSASLIGRSKQLFANGNNTYSPEDNMNAMLGLPVFGPVGHTSAGFSESYEYEVQPAAFTRLRTGGPAHGWEVDGIVFQNGRVFRGSGRTWLPVTFRQRH